MFFPHRRRLIGSSSQTHFRKHLPHSLHLSKEGRFPPFPCHSLTCLRQQYTLLKPSGPDPAAENLPNITVYPDYATQSGKPLYRRFCSICGAKLSALTPLNNDIISIPAGILPQAGKEWKPHKEQFVQDKVGWVPELGDLVQHLQGPTGEVVGGLSNKPAEAIDERVDAKV